MAMPSLRSSSGVCVTRARVFVSVGLCISVIRGRVCVCARFKIQRNHALTYKTNTRNPKTTIPPHTHTRSEIVGAPAYQGQRHMNIESLYEYGSRAGFWRLHRLFTERHMPCTVYLCLCVCIFTREHRCMCARWRCSEPPRYTHTHTYINAYLHTYSHTYTHVFTKVYECALALERTPEMHAFTHLHTYIYILRQVYECALALERNPEIHTQICIHIYIYSRTHAGVVCALTQERNRVRADTGAEPRDTHTHIQTCVHTNIHAHTQVYACALALERNPEAAQAMVEADWEIASHGYRYRLQHRLQHIATLQHAATY